jgi:hypothetical protein
VSAAQPVLTATLRDGTVVLAKMYNGEPCPMHYANRTQAAASAVKNGGEVIQRGRPFYVAYIQHDPAPAANPAPWRVEPHPVKTRYEIVDAAHNRVDLTQHAALARIVAAVNAAGPVVDGVQRLSSQGHQDLFATRAHLSRCVAALEAFLVDFGDDYKGPTFDQARAALAAVKE